MEIVQRPTDYSLRILLDLARTGGEGPRSVRELARANDIPGEFLRKIAQLLAAAGIVETVRGRNGGLRLARDPSAITLLDVMRALDTVPTMNRCLPSKLPGKGICGRETNCPLRKRLREFGGVMEDFFADVTLADILADNAQ